MRKEAIAIVIFALTGCGGGGSQRTALPTASASVSESCLSSVKTAAAVDNRTQEFPEMVASFDECTTAVEWLAAANQYPRIVGYSSEHRVGRLELEVACERAPQSATCADGVEKGFITLK
jgi:hypothetical protein